MSTGWRDDERIVGVLDAAELMFLAVAGRHGPHVTPLAFDRDGENLWAVTPRDSAKARAIDRDGRVGVLLRSRGRSVIAQGTAKLVDPLTGRGLGTMLRPDLPLTALSYLTRNRRRVVDAVLDHPSPALPLSRIGVRISLDRVALLSRERVRSVHGEWPSPGTLLDGDLPPVAPPELAGVPAAVQSLLRRDNPGAVLGWHTTDGPVALPARWGAAGTISTPADAFTLTGALSAAAACLSVEKSTHRLQGVRGLVLTGTGRAQPSDGLATIALDASHLTWWAGEESGSVSLSAPETQPGASR